MLIDFAITNYRSIKDRQVFSMLTAGKVKELPDNVAKIDKNINLLKSAVIYGRNASGKSNFLEAFYALRNMVDEPSEFRMNGALAFYEPFKLEANNLKMPVEFEINFIAENKIKYNYHISFLEDKIVNESLYYFPNKVKAKLFIREAGKPIDFSDVIKGNKKQIEEYLYPHQLFLSMVGTYKIEQLIIPYQYFEKSILLFDNGKDFSENLVSIVESDKAPFYKENLTKLLHIADTGIEGLVINKSKKTNSNPLSQLKVYEYEISTKHTFRKDGKKMNDIYMQLEEESEGTIKLLAIGGFILDALNNGSVFIIDELEKCLHPKLTRTLIYMFNNPKTNPKNAQLIFATHDVSLLSNEIFRRDQIWFTDKEANGETILYSLSDLKEVRNTVAYEKYYMRGTFGATPVINEYDLNFKFEEDEAK
jgi:AAA15 family ATPase/GTPase